MQGFYKTLSCTHSFNHTIFLQLLFILCSSRFSYFFTFSVAVYSLLYFCASIWDHEESLCIYFSIDLVVNNSINFGVPVYVFIWPSFFKKTFVGYRILDCYFLSTT